MFKTLLLKLVNIVVPPRASERAVAALTLEDLHNLQTADGLPYHDPIVRALVWELKYYAASPAAALAGALLAEEVLHLAGEELGVPLLVPVPMHESRRKTRGHNQTELLCTALLKELSPGTVEYRPQALARIVDTPTQQGLERARRLKNVHGSMRADPAAAKDRACIVIDDVTTTGATLSEAKRALHEAGARSVQTVALAYS